MEPLPDLPGALAIKYCGGGWGGYALVLFGERGARDAFASATTAGGLQPDVYCAARLEQANCESRLGNHDAALAVLDELAAGAPDLTKIEEMRAQIRSRRGSGRATVGN